MTGHTRKTCTNTNQTKSQHWGGETDTKSHPLAKNKLFVIDTFGKGENQFFLIKYQWIYQPHFGQSRQRERGREGEREKEGEKEGGGEGRERDV